MARAPEACDLYFADKHVLVTGGSEGLGLALAARAVRGGAAAVTIVARTRQKLDAALARLERERPPPPPLQQPEGQPGGNGRRRRRAPPTTLIQAFSADVTDAQALERAVRAAERAAGEAAAAAEAAAEAAEAAASGAAAPPPPANSGDDAAQAQAQRARGVDVLLACAGAAEPGYFQEAAASGAFARQLALNYLGVVHAVAAVYGGMVERAGRLGRWRAEQQEQEEEQEEEEARGRGRRRARGHGGGGGGEGGSSAPSSSPQRQPPPPPPPQQQHILIVASAMSLLNFVGYAAYAPSKWALRGLAEGLRNELQGSGGGGGAGAAAGSGAPRRRRRLGAARASLLSSLLPSSSSRRSSCSDVRVTIAFPPDVDTPGYAAENRTKPPECASISEGSPLYSADAVARAVARGMASGAFVAPNPSPVLALLQALARGVVPASAGPLGFSGWRGWLALPLEMLLGLLGPVVASAAGAEHDAVARQGAPRRFAALWAGGGGRGDGGAGAAAAAS